MKASYWQRGESLDFKNDTDELIEAGTIIALSGRIGVVGSDIFPDKLGSIHVTGVFEIAKTDASEEIAMGAAVYFDGNGITASESGESEEETASTLAGWAAQASAANDETVYVKIG